MRAVSTTSGLFIRNSACVATVLERWGRIDVVVVRQDVAHHLADALVPLLVPAVEQESDRARVREGAHVELALG